MLDSAQRNHFIFNCKNSVQAIQHCCSEPLGNVKKSFIYRLDECCTTLSKFGILSGNLQFLSLSARHTVFIFKDRECGQFANINYYQVFWSVGEFPEHWSYSNGRFTTLTELVNGLVRSNQEAFPCSTWMSELSAMFLRRIPPWRLYVILHKKMFTDKIHLKHVKYKVYSISILWSNH